MIVDDVDAALPELRAQAESLMTSRCDIERATTGWSEVEKKSLTVWDPVALDVPCALDVPPAGARALLTGEAVTPEAPVVKIPVDVEGVRPDDRVTIDGELVAWVTHVPQRTRPVQQRLACRWVR